MVTMIILFGNFYLQAYIYGRHTHKSHVNYTNDTNVVSNGVANGNTKKLE